LILYFGVYLGFEPGGFGWTNGPSFSQVLEQESPGVEEVSEGAEKRRSGVSRRLFEEASFMSSGVYCLKALALKPS